MFDYRITIPSDEPPGLVLASSASTRIQRTAVQGGASGALIVEGLQKTVPSLADLDERVLVLRDQQRIGPEASGASVPAFDISANWVPITYSQGAPAMIQERRGGQELWRVLNAGADTIFNLQILVDNIAQPVEVLPSMACRSSTEKRQPCRRRAASCYRRERGRSFCDASQARSGSAAGHAKRGIPDRKAITTQLAQSPRS